MATSSESLAAIESRFPKAKCDTFRRENRVAIDVADMNEFFPFSLQTLSLDLLIDITCVDYLNYRGATHRFGLVYILGNSENGDRLTVRVYLDESSLTVPSLVPIWEGANWMEREVWDMFGIRFEGHPDLRRILLPEEFAGHPLRKDYPLQGRGERHNFPVIARGQA